MIEGRGQSGRSWLHNQGSLVKIFIFQEAIRVQDVVGNFGDSINLVRGLLELANLTNYVSNL